MERVACFKSGSRVISVLLDDTACCMIPWEVTEHADKGKILYAGICGTRGGVVVLPTIWADLGKIQPGVDCGQDHSRPPTPSLWRQELEQKADRLDYTLEGELGLYSGEKLLSSVPFQGGDGVSDHRALTHRDAADQHTIASIQGLAEALENIPAPSEPITNMELEEILS